MNCLFFTITTNFNSTMKAKVVRFHTPGEPNVLRFDEVDLAEPDAGEVRIRHTAIGLNFQDIYARSGLYPVPVPSGLGTEAAGVVEAVGAGVTDFHPGDRVCYISGPVMGAYATHRNYPAERLLHAPDHISDEQLAAMMLKSVTVEYLMRRCYPVQKGQHVLMHAAAGGIGLLAGQWGRHLGARMIGVVAGPEKVALARANGYGHVIDRLTEDVVQRVRALTRDAGVPVVYDSVGKNSFEQSINCLSPRGYFVSFGTTTGAPPPVEAATLQKKGSLYFTRPTLVTYTASTADLRASAAVVFNLCARGVLKVSINQRYALADAAQAHADLAAGRTSGSSVLVP
ncbi:quinone oxidoreductase [Burkholderia orbicola]|uniref:quinone oxidoreductase family protein n=2 Tax=Burkholderia TaxID=32008 RepID=UPI0023DD9873|nr:MULTISPECIES: quinone oxidoreductase [Burkholderia cepacia complex]MDN7486009.1 quinone oxidoreductase [Burkholderia orbicola]